jgi:sarcosine oxidase subunit gamma
MADVALPEPDFPPRVSAFGAWRGLATEDLLVKPIERDGMCVIHARNGQTDALKQKLRAHYGLEPPTRPECVSNGETTLIGTAPESWLMTRPDTERLLAAELREKLHGLASIADQSGAYARLRISGSGAAALLQKAAFIDLDGFTPGAAATTQIAHLGLILWRPSADQAYDLALFRSSARDFIHWIETALPHAST